MSGESNTSVLVGVCTYQRPLMLAKCLESLAAQVRPTDVDIQIVVVDNEADAPRRADVNRFRTACPYVVHYVHEPKRGIAAARNAVLDLAKQTKTDWVAFIDDDETAAPDWIAALMTPHYRDTPVLQGRHIVVPPEPRPFWCISRTPVAATHPFDVPPEGDFLKTAITNNVRFSADIIRSGIRFNERLGLMGGEDGEFFTTAYRRGYHIRKTMQATTYEVQHRARVSYFGQAYRSYWCSASDVRRLAVAEGWPKTYALKLHTVPTNLIAGAVEIIFSPIFLVAGLRQFKRRAIAGGKKIGKGLGRAAGMLGVMPQPYANVVGE